MHLGKSELRGDRAWVCPDRLLGRDQGLIVLLVFEKQGRGRHERVDVSGPLLQHLVDQLVRSGRVARARRDRRQPDGGRRKALGVCRQLLQQRLRVAGAARGGIVVREDEAIAGLLGDVRDRLQVRLGLRRAVRHEVKHGERAIRRDVLRIDRNRRLQLALGRRKIGRTPVEVCQREPCAHRRGRRFNGFLERCLGLIAMAPRQLESTEVPVAGAAVWIFANRPFDFGYGRVKVLEAGQRVAFDNLSLDIVRSHRQSLVRSRLRVFELPREQEVTRGPDLDVRVAGQQISRANVFRTCVVDVAQALVCLGEFQASLSKHRVPLYGVPVLDHRLPVFPLSRVLIAAPHVFALGYFGVLPAGAGGSQTAQRRNGDGDSCSAHINFSQLRRAPHRGTVTTSSAGSSPCGDSPEERRKAHGGESAKPSPFTFLALSSQSVDTARVIDGCTNSERRQVVREPDFCPHFVDAIRTLWTSWIVSTHKAQ